MLRKNVTLSNSPLATIDSPLKIIINAAVLNYNYKIAMEMANVNVLLR